MGNPSPKGPYGGGDGTDLPTTLFVRNLPYKCRDEDLRGPFGRFGAIGKIDLPTNYYTGEPRGFGFVRFVDPADAAVAKHQMDRYVLQDRELFVSYAVGDKKKPSDMKARNGGRNSGRFDRTRSPSRYRHSPPQRHARYSRSSAPRHAMSMPRSYDYASPRRSMSPRDRREVEVNVQHETEFNGSRSRSQCSARGRSRNPSPSPVMGRSLSRSRSRSRSVSRSRNPRRSPRHEEEYRSEPNGEDRKSPSQ